MSRGIGWWGSGGDWLWRVSVMDKLRRLEEKLAGVKGDESGLRATAAEKIHQGANLTRPEAAAYLGVSTKKVQRMEAAGQLRRCPGLDGVVRYAARDVRQLASANGKEG